MGDYSQQQQLELERRMCLMVILRKAMMARYDGYFTDNDLDDMRREFGFTKKEVDNEMD